MRYESIADIYSANSKIREGFSAVVSGISPDEAKLAPDGEKWTIEQLAEHVSTVEGGIARICTKLLAAAKADGKPSDGSFALSANFGERATIMSNTKAEAPERVHPKGDVSLKESMSRLSLSREALDALRPDMESLDLSGHTFPHPFFGDLTAGEWLVITGLHEARHTAQIKRLLAAIRQ